MGFGEKKVKYFLYDRADDSFLRWDDDFLEFDNAEAAEDFLDAVYRTGAIITEYLEVVPFSTLNATNLTVVRNGDDIELKEIELKEME